MTTMDDWDGVQRNPSRAPRGPGDGERKGLLMSGTYTAYDLSESLQRVAGDLPSQGPVVMCLRAWGRSPDGGGSWEGGFHVVTSGGCHAYVTGWADYTGWGCQDGAYVWCSWRDQNIDYAAATKYGARFGFEPPPLAEWDEQPADLNRWLTAGCPDPWAFSHVEGA